MAIAFRAAAAGDTGGVAATSMTATIPASVQSGDVALVYATCVFHGPNLAISSTATTPQLIFSNNTQAFFNAGYALWWIPCGASDASATLTVTSTSSFMCAMIMAYSGADHSAQPDVFTSGDTGGTAQATWPAPSATTVNAGDWEVDFAAYLTGGATFTGHPLTLRVQPPNFVAGAVDSNGSVGGAGTGIGGGTWSSGVNTVFNGVTVGLKAAAGGSVSLPADAVTLAAPLLTPMVGPDPFPAPGVTLAAPAVSLTFGAASIPLPVATITLTAPPLAASGGQPSALPLDPDVAGGFFQSQQSPQGPPLGWGYIR